VANSKFPKMDFICLDTSSTAISLQWQNFL